MTERELQLLNGLSEADVADRRQRHGWNEIPDKEKRGILKIVLEVFTEPMFLLLVVCGVVYLLVGEPRDALLLLGFVLIMMGITIVQEGKTERTLDALRNLSSPRAVVIRDGGRRTVAGREVVPGDLMVLAEGERVAADAVLIWNSHLSADESLLTGESVPVRKQAVDDLDAAHALEAGRPGGEDNSWVYSGSLVVSGQAVAVARGTGASTEMGRIGRALASVVEEPTRLQRETGKLVRKIFAIAVLLCLTVVAVFGLTRGQWLEAVLSGITLAMAMLPEEFPVVLTIFLALGAWRISRKNVLARRMSAVESLGAATVLCSDKTGTITQNRMAIARLWAPAGAGLVAEAAWERNAASDGPVPESLHGLVEWGVLASRKDPFDPMEKAFVDLLGAKAMDGDHCHPDWDIVREYPLSREFLSVTHVWRSGNSGELAVAVKGAPETIMDLCHLPKERQAAIAAEVARMAAAGLRVLGVASGRHPGTACADGSADCPTDSSALPATQHDFDFTFLGLVGLADPIRPDVPEAVRLCRDAGIRVVMITGDYPATAANIARQVGLDYPERVITGAELEAMSPAELARRTADCQVFARVVPEQKLLLVRALKEAGELVAMTGDGVNDAPALKAAHIGVAMGERGTDVAREASALVLLDDDFSSIVAAVRIGRRIFDNLKKAMSYIVSVHIPIAGMSLLPVLLGWKDLVLLPVHIVFLELVIDPACSIVFEGQPEEKNLMRRPPRAAGESLFGAKPLLLSLLQGFAALGCVMLTWILAGNAGLGADTQRALAFISLIVSNLALILTNRSWSAGIFSAFAERNKALPWVVGGASLFLALVVCVPFLQEIFRFAAPELGWALAAAGLGLASVSWFEVVKLAARLRGTTLLQDRK
jgi:Ca2+-transporting ATPase